MLCYYMKLFIFLMHMFIEVNIKKKQQLLTSGFYLNSEGSTTDTVPGLQHNRVQTMRL